MKRLERIFAWLGGVMAVVLLLGLAGGTTNIFGLLVVSDSSAPTGASATGEGDLLVEDALEVDGATDLDGSLAVAGAATLASTLAVTGTTTFTGAATFNGGVDLASPGIALQTMRFCGQGPNATTATYIGPELPYVDYEGAGDSGAEDGLAVGGGICDGKDNTAEATADLVWTSLFAIKPVAMACATACGTDDTMTVQLRDDTADVTDMTCDITLAGAAAQCVVRDEAPATIAAGSAIAIEVVNDTDDDCSAGDIECYLWFTY